MQAPGPEAGATLPNVKAASERRRLNFQPLIDALADFITSWLGRAILLLYCLWPVFGGQQLAAWMTALGVDGIVGFLRGFATGLGGG